MAQEPVSAPALQNDEDVAQQPASPTGSSSSREGTRDTREKLKQTSIAGLTSKSATIQAESSNDKVAHGSAEQTTETAEEPWNGTRGRPAKKRSFEDLAKDDAETSTTVDTQPQPKRSDHKRMRSQEVHQPGYLSVYHEAEDDLPEETGIDAQKSPGGPGVLIDVPTEEVTNATTDTEKIQHNSRNSQTAESAPTASSSKAIPSSGFANTSTASPFGTGASNGDNSSDPSKSTSTSAFASSGLAAFASSDKSPFGAAASSKSPLGGGGGFGGPSTGGFGSAGGFSSTATTSFGGSSSTFGASKPFGTTSTFGARKPFGTTSAFGNGGSSFGSAKPFGSARKEDDDEEEAENDVDEETADSAKDDAQQDPRFRAQHIDTGEDDEETIFTSRARLYFFEGSWKERGTGVLKLNLRVTDDVNETDPESQSSNRKARLLMRADGTHRVILNSPVFKGMQFGASDGSPPTGKIMHLQSLEEAKPVPLQIKIGKEEVLKDLYTHLKALHSELQL